MCVPVISVAIPHRIELMLFIVYADCRLKESTKHMLLLMHWGNDAMLPPDDLRLIADIAIKDDANIVLMIDMHLGD